MHCWRGLVTGLLIVFGCPDGTVAMAWLAVLKAAKPARAEVKVGASRIAEPVLNGHCRQAKAVR
jgi:hypothetical protein